MSVRSIRPSSPCVTCPVTGSLPLVPDRVGEMQYFYLNISDILSTPRCGNLCHLSTENTVKISSFFRGVNNISMQNYTNTVVGKQ